MEQKLAALRACLERLRLHCPPSAEVLAREPDRQDILGFNVLRVVELCVDIGSQLIAGSKAAPPESMGSLFEVLADAGILERELARRLKTTARFREWALHADQPMEWDQLFRLARDQTGDFEEFARAVAQTLPRRDS